MVSITQNTERLEYTANHFLEVALYLFILMPLMSSLYMHNLGVPVMLQITDQSLSDVIPFHHEFERTFIILA